MILLSEVMERPGLTRSDVMKKCWLNKNANLKLVVVVVVVVVDDNFYKIYVMKSFYFCSCCQILMKSEKAKFHSNVQSDRG